jgi:hypothetical protein
MAPLEKCCYSPKSPRALHDAIRQGCVEELGINGLGLQILKFAYPWSIKRFELPFTLSSKTAYAQGISLSRNNWQMVVWLVYPDHILANRFIVTGHTIHSDEFHLRAQGLAQIYFQRSELSWARNSGEAIHCSRLELRAHKTPTASKAIILDLSCPRLYTHERISSLGSRSYVR